jgi:aryl-alcohol dehydrogenase-like predicted oxidoreductase
MDQIRLGGSGLHVSRMCLGMMSYGNDSDRYTRMMGSGFESPVGFKENPA